MKVSVRKVDSLINGTEICTVQINDGQKYEGRSWRKDGERHIFIIELETTLSIRISELPQKEKANEKDKR